MQEELKPEQASAGHDWLELTDRQTVTAGWAHHGVAVTQTGRIVAFDAAGDQVLVFTAEGDLVSRWSSGLTEGHGITTVVDDDGECVWIADPGLKMTPTGIGGYVPVAAGAHGCVVKFTLDGKRVRRLPVPPMAIYEHHRYSPTAVAVDNAPANGSGRIWVADGYGQNLVHVFAADGDYAGALPGTFDCPHGLMLDRRRVEPELYVADRENGRLQVYGLDGEFRRTVGEGMLRRPSALATSGDLLIVAELEARLAVLDANDTLIGFLGADEEAPRRPGWPNAVAADGRTIRPPLRAGHFNSPHGLAVDAEGNPIVAEWLIGGRLTKLLGRSS